MIVSRSAVIAALLCAAADLGAQGQPIPAAQPAPATQPAQPAPRIPRAAASTRASVQVLVDSRYDAKEGGWFGRSPGWPRQDCNDTPPLWRSQRHRSRASSLGQRLAHCSTVDPAPTEVDLTLGKLSFRWRTRSSLPTLNA